MSGLKLENLPAMLELYYYSFFSNTLLFTVYSNSILLWLIIKLEHTHSKLKIVQ